ncbi:tachykinin-4 isoform X3 [Lemur catta]|uniref:tachykinin-4 isoform X3 n=1 Tax=Lemur catta TaxID=9447 RepID=UPI001E26E2B2|nr:tachykinin-4 isoform X3 [Lemur catta]
MEGSRMAGRTREQGELPPPTLREPKCGREPAGGGRLWAARGSQKVPGQSRLTTLPCLSLLLLTGLSLCAAAGDGGEERALSTEAEPWITVTLEEGSPPITQRQLQQVKRGKASQFFGLMGKQMGGTPRIQPGRKAAPGYQSEQTVPGLLGRRRPSTEGREDEDQGSE